MISRLDQTVEDNISQSSVCVSIAMSSTRSLKKLCESCEKDQQCLLDNGDGSQVVCEHVISEESATATSINRCSDIMVIDEDDDDVLSSSVPLSIRSSSGNTIKDRKRKFPSFREFAEAGGDELKRKVLAMEKWSSLTIREPYLVTKAMEIEAMMKKTKQPGFYAEIENKEGELKNVWVSPMIYKELINYPLEQGETFITPLGPKESKETGYTYNNFAVQIVKDN